MNRKFGKMRIKFLLYEDFIINKLTGESVISKCLASRTQVFDLEKEEWSEKILDFLELRTSRLAEILHIGYVGGKMKAGSGGRAWIKNYSH